MFTTSFLQCNLNDHILVLHFSIIISDKYFIANFYGDMVGLDYTVKP